MNRKPLIRAYVQPGVEGGWTVRNWRGDLLLATPSKRTARRFAQTLAYEVMFRPDPTTWKALNPNKPPRD